MNLFDIKEIMLLLSISMCKEWIKKELQGLNLSDERLNQRSLSLLQRLEQHPKDKLSRACQGWAETKAAYRFLNNAKVSAQSLLKPHIESTLERIKYHKRVLCISDTSFISYSRHKPIKGMGPAYKHSDNGYFLHPSIAVSQEGINLGCLHHYTFVRDNKLDKYKTQSKRPIEEKESYRWLESYQAIDKAQIQLQEQGSETKLVFITDREGDFYELFALASKGSADFLIRAQKDRIIGSQRIENPAQSSNYLGTIEFEMAGRKGLRARTVQQSLYTARMSIRAKRGKQKLEGISTTILWAIEENPPEGIKGLRWILLSNLRVDDIDQAKKLIDWYKMRWSIETYFDVLKNLCKVEELRLRNFNGLENACALYQIITWRVLYMMSLSRARPDIRASCIFHETEIKVIYCATGTILEGKQPSLAQVVTLLAQLGGYLNRKNDGPPGYRIISRAYIDILKMIYIYEKMQQ